jgi:hypothetical protein
MIHILQSGISVLVTKSAPTTFDETIEESLFNTLQNGRLDNLYRDIITNMTALLLGLGLGSIIKNNGYLLGRSTGDDDHTSFGRIGSEFRMGTHIPP